MRNARAMLIRLTLLIPVLADNIAATGSGLYSTVCEANLAYSTVVSESRHLGRWRWFLFA